MHDNNVYEKAERIIRERRNKAIEENRLRNEEIDKKVPEVAEIKSKNMQNISSRLLAIIQSGKNVQEKIENEKRHNRQAIGMLKSRLIQHGYPEDYLEIHYTCPQCNDTGYYDGKRCECFMDLVKKLSVESLNVNTKLVLSSFDTFELKYYEDGNYIKGMQKVYDYCVEYAKNFDPSESPNVIMSGTAGLGKTHLSLAIAREVIQKGYSVAYDSAINFLRHIEIEHFNRENNHENDTIDIILDVDLLIIDDLGAEYESKFNTSTIYNIINSRINFSKPTIINTNFRLEEMEAMYDSRISSRISSMYDYLRFCGEDIRKIKKENRSIISD